MATVDSQASQENRKCVTNVVPQDATRYRARGMVLYSPCLKMGSSGRCIDEEIAWSTWSGNEIMAPFPKKPRSDLPSLV